MCTDTCPCYSSVYEFNENQEGVPTTINDAYYQYIQLALEAYNHHERIFSNTTKEYYSINEDWPVFVWSTDRNSSFTSFQECLAYWETKAEEDPSIDLR